MPPPRYPSDLSDEEWALLEPLLASSEKRGRPPKWPTPGASPTPSSTCLGAAARGECCPKSIRPGKPSTTTSVGGASTVGSSERTTGCESRCAGQRGATGTPERERDRQPGRQDHPVRRTRARLRWGEAADRKEAPLTGRHEWARARRARTRRRSPRSGRRAAPADGRPKAGAAPDGTDLGRRRVHRWVPRVGRRGARVARGAMGWRKSHAASGFYPADGWSRGRSRG